MISTKLVVMISLKIDKVRFQMFSNGLQFDVCAIAIRLRIVF